MQTDTFFFSFSCNWTLQTTGCSSPAETQAYTWGCAAKSKGVSWPFRLAVTGALSRGQEITLMLFHPSPLSLLLPISMGAESGTNICSPLQSITYIEYKERQKLSPSSGIRSIYKLAHNGKGKAHCRGSCKDHHNRSPSSPYHLSLQHSNTRWSLKHPCIQEKPFKNKIVY